MTDYNPYPHRDTSHPATIHPEASNMSPAGIALQNYPLQDMQAQPPMKTVFSWQPQYALGCHLRAQNRISRLHPGSL